MISHFPPDCDVDIGFENILHVKTLLIILYLSVKFDDIHLRGFKIIVETCFDL